MHTTRTVTVPHRLSSSEQEEGPEFPSLLTALLHTQCRCVYRPTLMRFLLGRHLLNYDSLSANHGGLSRGSRCRPELWEIPTSSRPSWLPVLCPVHLSVLPPHLSYTPLGSHSRFTRNFKFSSPPSKQPTFLPCSHSLMPSIFILWCWGAFYSL